MTRPNAPRRLLPSRHQRTRLTQTLIADLAERLTPRDAEILDAVWEHRVLTTDQLTAIFFPSVHRPPPRLLALHELRALDRFRPWAPPGAAHGTGSSVPPVLTTSRPNAASPRPSSVTGPIRPARSPSLPG